MNGPARIGVVIYANNINRLTDFYAQFFGMTRLRATAGLAVLEIEGFNVVIHAPPVEMPAEHFNSVKLFLTVASLEHARNTIADFGGTALEGEWSNPRFKLCNILDPEGNPIQIREFSA